VDTDILAFVSSDNFIPLRFSDILSLSCSDSILPVAAKDKFFLVSSLTFCSFLKKFKVFSLCLNPKYDPALSNILYSGFNLSI